MLRDRKKPNFLVRLITMLLITARYVEVMIRKRVITGLGLASTVSCRERAKEINKLLRGYPRNHDYEVVDNPLIPCYRLFVRAKLVERCYSQNLESFLDIGCCRGFYVLDSALRPSCRIAVGIDVHKDFIAISEATRQHLAIPNAVFYHATLHDVASNPAFYGGPFQTVMCLGTYHYMFWGSALSTHAYYDHRSILERINRICTDRVILSARLEIPRLPPDLRERAEHHPMSRQYTSAGFLKAAEEFFHVTAHGFLGSYTLYVLTKKDSAT